MKRFSFLFLAVPLAAAVIPGRYIIELTNEPLADHVARVPGGMHSAEADRHRAAILSEQAAARAAVETMGGSVTGAVDVVRNALFVNIPEDQVGHLSNLAGVQRVHSERLFQKTAGPAPSLHHISEGLSLAGIANPGAGIKIGMIDSGITIGHPAFQDTGFKPPAGFPVADSAADQAFTNNKVIVARSYAKFFPTKDPDQTAMDDDGHGTGTAMVAAGVPNMAPLETIRGVAPQAYLGIYKVFGTPGINDSAPESAVLAAINDAVSDGMDIINLSLGSGLAGSAAQDPEVSSIESAAALGVIVVVSAGNNGPNPATVGTPAIAPSAIAVGASTNDRHWAASVHTSDGSSFEALAGSSAIQSAPVSGKLVDITKFDSTGLGCSTYPANALSGAIALIQRGTCFFTVKLSNAQAAGAVAAVVYDNLAEPLIVMSTGGAPIPGNFVSQQDGATLRSLAASGAGAGLQFAMLEGRIATSMAAFSAAGPTVDLTIKPDLSAAGTDIYTAAESANSAGDLYDPSGYTLSQGTSFSAPAVSGAAAILKQTRPGLTAAQYRSLLINSADGAFNVPGYSASVQQAGAGILNLSAALNATAAAAPVSISFGTSAAPTGTRNLTVTNVGASPDTFEFFAEPQNLGGPAPALSVSTVTLNPGGSAAVSLQFSAGGLTAGDYEGVLNIQGSHSSTLTRVPYWYAVPSGTPQFATILYIIPTAAVSTQVNNAAVFRVTDGSGLPVSGVTPKVSVVSGGGTVTGVSPISGYGAAVYSLNAKMGPVAGANVFQIQVGSVTTQVSITAQ